MKKIYFDNNATTKIDPLVAEVILAELQETPSNPSSIHQLGQKAKAKLFKARQTVANYLQVRPVEIFFNSGATEGLNTILRSVAQKKEAHIITTDLEHACLYKTFKFLEGRGSDITYLKPKEKGRVDVKDLESAIKNTTALIAISWVNSETGIKTNIEEIANWCEQNSIPLLIDGVAFLGKEKKNLPKGVTYACFSGHKIHGPQGVGFSVIRQGVKIEPLLIGGEQEGGLRAGTENVAGIMGLAKAIELIPSDVEQKISKLRDFFELELTKISSIMINGANQPRVCNVSNVAFLNEDGESLLARLDRAGVIVSLGSACASGALEPSRVLLNMGYSKDRVMSSIRFSFSRMNTLEEIQEALHLLFQILNR
ncbi:Cysteine desulfurase [Candidatus Rubidus massiliensis]|nr:Cysteine desulfurase [Candidatus Rubidus massiliensis]